MEVDTIETTEDAFGRRDVAINSVWKLEVWLLITPDVTSEVTLGVTRDVTFADTLVCDDLVTDVESTLDVGNVEIGECVTLSDESVTLVGVTLRLIDGL